MNGDGCIADGDADCVAQLEANVGREVVGVGDRKPYNRLAIVDNDHMMTMMMMTMVVMIMIPSMMVMLMMPSIPMVSLLHSLVPDPSRARSIEF